jgi:CysZ protein
MIGHAVKALTQFSDPKFWAVLWKALALTIVVFIGVLTVSFWLLPDSFVVAVDWLPDWLNSWLSTALEWIAQFGVFAIMVVLFPAISTLFISIFLDDIADAVEERHYPNEPTGSSLDVKSAFIIGLQFALVVIGLNILVLPFYLLMIWLPIINVVIFYGLNGYLLGREYYELVALRHLPGPAAKSLRRNNRGPVFIAGVIITFALTIPVVNLLAPIFATAMMVHVYKAIRRKSTI